MSSAWRKWRSPLALGAALACLAGDAAMAQFYFRPFAYTYRYELPPPDEDDDFDGPRFASRRAVARILAREGFQLVGPLGRRGDQIVATGVSRREGETRFFIDPFEGVILHAVNLGPPPEAERPARRDDGFTPPLGGSHPVVKEIGRDRIPPPEDARGNDRIRRAARPAPEDSAPEPANPHRREAARPVPQPNAPGPDVKQPAAAPAPVAAPASKAAPAKPVETAKPVEPQKPIEWAKPAEISRSAEPPKAAEAPKPVAAKPIEPAKPVEAAKTPAPARQAEPKKPVEARAEPTARPAAPVTEVAKSPAAKAPAPRAMAARSTGASHRAIVPPKPAEGVTVVTPSTPATSTAHSPAGGKTPQSVAMPKSE
jgi:hypothetical protein